MNQLDIYYRALLEYRKLTGSNSECSSFLNAVSEADAEKDKIVIVRNVCTVDDDWVKAIEEGLVHIEKAIAEERQFIRSNGEVVPIEKVKHITKESVQHLAKHSNLITKEQEGDEIIPDQLYNVERLNDYTVYENRFLYMLLCYLRDFITIRYNKILDLSNRYDGELSMNKEIVQGRRRLSYRVELHEERKDDKYLRDHNPSKDVIDRISLILKAVLSYLSTPLMEYAAKAPLLKPPITKTNVLKMDKHFKKTVELYDYIIAYDKAGYIIEEKRIELSPFKGELSAEMSEACAMMSFLTYEYGLDIRAELKNVYELEEQKRKDEKLRQRAEQLTALRKRMRNSSLDTEEYILALEKQLKLLETDNARIEGLMGEIGEMRLLEQSLRERIDAITEEKTELAGQLEVIEDKHLDEMSALRVEYDTKLFEERENHESEKKELISTFNSREEVIRTELRNAKKTFDDERAQMRQTAAQKQAEFERLSASYEECKEQMLVAEGRLKAFRAEHGLMGDADDFSDKESFKRLERELGAFIRFYDKQWGNTKKKIRKDLLNLKNLKG